MSVIEHKALDTAAILSIACELGDLINRSADMAEYLYWKDAVARHPDVPPLVENLKRKKEKFAECERFGRFHPEYHKALEEVKAAVSELDKIEAVARFKEAENRLDQLLYEVAKIIAHSVSESIKVPGGDELSVTGGCGCGAGGGCRGGCG